MTAAANPAAPKPGNDDIGFDVPRKAPYNSAPIGPISATLLRPGFPRNDMSREATPAQLRRHFPNSACATSPHMARSLPQA